MIDLPNDVLAFLNALKVKQYSDSAGGTREYSNLFNAVVICRSAFNDQSFIMDDVAKIHFVNSLLEIIH